MLRFASPALRNLIGRFADGFALARISKAHVSKAHVSNAWLSHKGFSAFVKTKLLTVKLLIAIVLLQLVGANVGAHQLHPDTKIEEGGQHSHLQLTAQVTTLSQCDIKAHRDAHGHSNESGTEHDLADYHGVANYGAANVSAAHHGELSHTDKHQVVSTETQDVDICLDCQCHGGHASLIGGLTPLAPILFTDSPVLLAFAYFPPESLPSYRPPIV
ncbi:hypothetical protein [Shewanella sp. SR44-3]|uniref:hypothetical protein n=1 Tax=Shewanella sp. SR44-3 TaxID=2760936 RepID=UPI002175B184|nr:hypothetical protein [Shewanella sp. SR44-3]